MFLSVSLKVYKMMRELDRVDGGRLYPSVEGSRARDHILKITGKGIKSDMKKNILTQLVVGIWNALHGGDKFHCSL